MVQSDFCQFEAPFLIYVRFSIASLSGILRLYQSELLQLSTIEDVGGFLGKLPSSLDSDTLFSQIESIQLTSKKFQQVLQQEHLKDSSNR